MEFGIDKYAKTTFKCGQLIKTTDFDFDIKELDQGDRYTYSGINERGPNTTFICEEKDR